MNDSDMPFPTAGDPLPTMPADSGASLPEAAAAPAGIQARLLMRRCGQATLATTFRPDDDPERDGAMAGMPYASLVLVALCADATPLLLLSGLSDHTRNLQADPRACLLFDGTAGRSLPIAGPRVSVMGRVEVIENPALMARFLARHPGARLFAGFADFQLYRLVVTRVHLVAGFAAAFWLEPDAVLAPAATANAFSRQEADGTTAEMATVSQINSAFPAVLTEAAVHAGGSGEGWKMTALDPDGADLLGPSGRLRLLFPCPAADAASVLAVLPVPASGTGAADSPT